MKNKILFTVLVIFTIFALVSCENEPIFYNIAKEVPLLDSVVTGNVYSMVEQGGYLFAANGKIFRKAKYDEVTPQGNPWKIFDKPEGAIIKLASTDDYLYALSVADTSSENPTYTIYSSPVVWGDKKPTWTKIEASGVKTIFDNEALPSTGKLRAFYSTKDGVYELTNGTASSENILTAENLVSSKEEVDKEELDAYIMKLFNITFIDPRIRKQIKQYVEEYHYTYSGIRKTLIYFYEIKGNSLEKSNGGIGIVPHVYQKAHNYYLALWQAQQKNENKVVKEFVPTVKEIVIPRPQRNVKKRNLFSFLDEEEGMNGK